MGPTQSTLAWWALVLLGRGWALGYTANSGEGEEGRGSLAQCIPGWESGSESQIPRSVDHGYGCLSLSSWEICFSGGVRSKELACQCRR